MEIKEKFLKEFVKVTQQASIATLPKIGKKDIGCCTWKFYKSFM